jgi:serine/threonine protein kinase HipA of HipAB toxin-antitoxin module
MVCLPTDVTRTTAWWSVQAAEAHMSGTTPDPAGGANPFGELAKLALAATERNMALARSWSDALLTTLKEQSEDARRTLTTQAASLEAMERALASQEETNRALRQSLEGYREIVDHYAAAQERTARLVQTAVDNLKAAGEGQMEAARAMLTPPTWATGATAATEPFTQIMKAWADAFARFSGGRR